MDYEKKYKEALERARKLQENSNGMILKKWLWNIFPELKESKDNRIMRVIRGWIYSRPASFFDNGISKEEILAWLEKQGKQEQLYIRFGEIPTDEKSKIYQGDIEVDAENGVSVYPAFEDSEGNIVLGLSLPITKTSLYTQQHLLEYDNRACYLVSGDYVGKGTDGEPLLRNIKIIREIKDFRVKQGEQNLIMAESPQLGEQKPANSYCQENCKGFQETGKCFADGDCKAKGKAKSIYEVKPKFKVGDWICNDMCDVHIASIENGMYYFDEGDGLSIVFVDEHYHVWTIEDAKDGGVLVDRYNNIGIFQECVGICWHSYIYLGCDSELRAFHIGGSHEQTDIHPATKEQRYTLMKAMTDAGCIFDFEKKELKKLGQSEVTKTSDQEIGIVEIPFGAKDSELQEATYYIPKGFHAEIDDDNKVVVKKGESLHTAWSEEDETKAKMFLVNKGYPIDANGIFPTYEEMYNIIREGLEKQVSQKPTEWSEDDEHRVKDTIYFLDTAKKHYASTVELEACIDWLKSLKQRIGE